MLNSYVSYMANDRDLKGVLVINYLLKKKFNSKFPYTCICIENVSENIKNILKNNGINVVEYNLSDILKKLGLSDEYVEFIISKHYYGKLLIFDLIQYENVMFLDTDILILKPLDEYFNLLNISDNTICMVYDTQACLVNNNMELCFVKNEFNSGVIFLKPNKELYNKLYNIIKCLTFDTFKDKIIGDQILFNIAYTEKIINIVPLHPKFNISPNIVEICVNNNLLNINELVIIHYMDSMNPWDLVEQKIDSYKIQNFVELFPENNLSLKLFKKWVDVYFEYLNDLYFSNKLFNTKYSIINYTVSNTNYFSLDTFDNKTIKKKLELVEKNISKF